MRVAVLVPRRAGVPDRDALWRFCRPWWVRDHQGWPIVEADGPPGLFNRSAALNTAARTAGGWDVAVIIDSDVLVDAGQVRAAVERADATGGIVLAYSQQLRLNQAATRRVVGGYRGKWDRPGMFQRMHAEVCSCAVAVPRRLWDEVGGFDEQFVGWGYEDTAFRYACETLSGVAMGHVPGDLYHLWHKPAPEAKTNAPTVLANRARCRAYTGARGDPAAMRRLLAGEHFATSNEEAKRTFGQVDGLQVKHESQFGRIPRILHRTVPERTTVEVEGWWAAARELHPGWEARTWREPLDPADWPRTSHVWDLCRSGAQRAGLVRLEALWRDGGVYLDSDVELYRPLGSLCGAQIFAGWEDNRCIPDAVLGAAPGLPVVERMLEEAVRRVAAGQDAWASGPGVTTEFLSSAPEALLLPPGSFYPYHYTTKATDRDRDHRAEQPWAFGAHHWAASWVGHERPVGRSAPRGSTGSARDVRPGKSYVRAGAPIAGGPSARTWDVIIPFAGDDEHRTRALEWVVSRWRAEGVDPIVGRAPSGEPWSKGAAVADALERSTADVLVVSDADVWADTTSACAEQVAAGGAAWVVPHKMVRRLTDGATAHVLGGAPFALDLPMSRTAYLGIVGGGIVVLGRDLYDDVPLDPRFLGWGGEDHAWGFALSTIAGRPARADGNLWHLWHPPAGVRARPNELLQRRYSRARRRSREMLVLLAEIRDAGDREAARNA